MGFGESILSVTDISEVPKWKLSVAINWNMTLMQIKLDKLERPFWEYPPQ